MAAFTSISFVFTVSELFGEILDELAGGPSGINDTFGDVVNNGLDGFS